MKKTQKILSFILICFLFSTTACVKGKYHSLAELFKAIEKQNRIDLKRKKKKRKSLNKPRYINPLSEAEIQLPRKQEKLLFKKKKHLKFKTRKKVKRKIKKYRKKSKNKQVAMLIQPKYVIEVEATAYSSTVGQTDSTPCITASNLNVCKRGREDIIATNALPFGTKVKFPELDPNKFYIVQDRMNKRYKTRVDFWKKRTIDAKRFGLKKLVMEVY